MLKQCHDLSRDSRWSDVKRKLESDERYKAVDSSTRREDWFRDFVRTLKEEMDNDEARERSERDKQDRIAASIKKREEEVQETLSSSLRERDKEREHHKKQEAEQHFNALLVDLVRNFETSWHDAKKTLRKDHRWDMAELLDRAEKEKLFDEHIENLARRTKEMFHRLMDETTMSLTATWREIKKAIKDDARYNKFSTSERKKEREFLDYQHEKIVMAKADFRELLKETRIISYKSKAQIQESDAHMKDIENVLENDKRFLVLSCMAEERGKLLWSYIDDLAAKGPPPPPTATEPNRRGLK